MSAKRAPILAIREDGLYSTTFVTTSTSVIPYAIPPTGTGMVWGPSTSLTVETIITTTKTPTSSAATGITSTEALLHSSTSTPNFSGDGNKLGGGAVAGVAIACLFIGAAIGCLLMYLITSRRRRYEGRRFRDGRGGFRDSGKAAEASATITVPQIPIVENNLPEPTPSKWNFRN